MHCPRALSVVVAVVIQSVCAVSQDTSSRTEPSSETATLPPVVVSATRGGPRSAEDLPVSVTVISREEIEASPGTTIDEILRTTPGIQLQLTNSNTILPIIPSISMRGLGLGDNGTRTLVLVDGLPANGAFFGMELISTLGPFRDVSLSLGYTYTDAQVTENRDDPALEGNRVEGAPVHIVTFSTTYHRPRGLQLTLRGRYLSEQFQDTSNETRLPGHVVIDASASYPVTRHLTVFLLANNLFDEDYVVDAFGGLGLRGVPRQIFGGVRVALP